MIARTPTTSHTVLDVIAASASDENASMGYLLGLVGKYPVYEDSRPAQGFLEDHSRTSSRSRSSPLSKPRSLSNHWLLQV